MKRSVLIVTKKKPFTSINTQKTNNNVKTIVIVIRLGIFYYS